MATDQSSEDNISESLLGDKLWSLHKRVRELDLSVATHILDHRDGIIDAATAFARISEDYEQKAATHFEMGQISVHLEQAQESLRAEEKIENRDLNAEQPEQQRDYLSWLRPALDAAAEAFSDERITRRPRHDRADELER